jgi:hypothetical protein
MTVIFEQPFEVFGQVFYGMKEVKEAITNAQAFLHQLPEVLDTIIDNQESLGDGEFTRRYMLLMKSIHIQHHLLSVPIAAVLEGLQAEKNKQKSPTSSGIGYRA